MILSSLLSILGYFLLSRYKQRKASQASQAADDQPQPLLFEKQRQPSLQSNEDSRAFAPATNAALSSQSNVSVSEFPTPPDVKEPSSRWSSSSSIRSPQGFRSEGNPSLAYHLTLRSLAGDLKGANPFRRIENSKNDMTNAEKPKNIPPGR
jgi:hypothetical protein